MSLIQPIHKRNRTKGASTESADSENERNNDRMHEVRMRANDRRLANEKTAETRFIRE